MPLAAAVRIKARPRRGESGALRRGRKLVIGRT